MSDRKSEALAEGMCTTCHPGAGAGRHDVDARRAHDERSELAQATSPTTIVEPRFLAPLPAPSLGRQDIHTRHRQTLCCQNLLPLPVNTSPACRPARWMSLHSTRSGRGVSFGTATDANVYQSVHSFARTLARRRSGPRLT